MAETYRLRYDRLSSSLGAAIPDASATVITFASKLTYAGGDVPTIGTDRYLPLIIDNETLYLTAYTSGATTGTISRGKEGSTAAAHSSGATVRHAPTARDIASGRLAYKDPVVATLTTSANTAGPTWADLATDHDIVIPALPGDMIRVSGAPTWGNEAAWGRMTFATMNGATRVSIYNNVASGGVAALVGDSGAYRNAYGEATYRVQAGDVFGGLVTVRLLWGRDNGGASSKTLTTKPYWSVENLGSQAV